VNSDFLASNGNRRGPPKTRANKSAVNLDDVVDSSFVEAAVKELGPYRR
jgi:hypothetical protein